jgi:hypothetical protein
MIKVNFGKCFDRRSTIVNQNANNIAGDVLIDTNF